MNFKNATIYDKLNFGLYSKLTMSDNFETMKLYSGYRTHNFDNISSDYACNEDGTINTFYNLSENAGICSLYYESFNKLKNSFEFYKDGDTIYDNRYLDDDDWEEDE